METAKAAMLFTIGAYVLLTVAAIGYAIGIKIVPSIAGGVGGFWIVMSIRAIHELIQEKRG